GGDRSDRAAADAVARLQARLRAGGADRPQRPRRGRGYPAHRADGGQRRGLGQDPRREPGLVSARFYAELPLLTEFSAVTRPERFAALPADWYIAACDVRDSPAAVRLGNYK